jgi:hypothetical protein
VTATTTPIRSGGLLRVQPVPPERDKDDVKIRLGVALVVLFVRPYILMIGLDVANIYWPQVPALGYWAVMVLGIALNELGSVFRDPRRRWWDK